MDFVPVNMSVSAELVPVIQRIPTFVPTYILGTVIQVQVPQTFEAQLLRMHECCLSPHVLAAFLLHEGQCHCLHTHLHRGEHISLLHAPSRSGIEMVTVGAIARSHEFLSSSEQHIQQESLPL